MLDAGESMTLEETPGRAHLPRHQVAAARRAGAGDRPDRRRHRHHRAQAGAARAGEAGGRRAAPARRGRARQPRQGRVPRHRARTSCAAPLNALRGWSHLLADHAAARPVAGRARVEGDQAQRRPPDAPDRRPARHLAHRERQAEHRAARDQPGRDRAHRAGRVAPRRGGQGDRPALHARRRQHHGGGRRRAAAAARLEPAVERASSSRPSAARSRSRCSSTASGCSCW